MSTRSIHKFLNGPGAYVPGSPWNPVTAIIASVLVLMAGQLAPMAIIALVSPAGSPVPAPANNPDGLLSLAERIGPFLLLAAQATLAVLTIVAAGLFGGRATENLRLAAPRDGALSFIFALILMVPLLAALNAFAYALSPEGFMQDFRQFASMARSPQPLPNFLAIGVGAPVWEELLFRGFLLAPLAVWLGFWPAAIIVSASWTAMHVGYSISGLTEVFVIGLYFAWLLKRTGSLWVPIFCHGVYNSSLFLALRQITL